MSTVLFTHLLLSEIIKTVSGLIKTYVHTRDLFQQIQIRALGPVSTLRTFLELTIAIGHLDSASVVIIFIDISKLALESR